MSKYVYLASMDVKIEHTVGCLNQDYFSKCMSDGHASQNMCLKKVNIAKIYAFVYRNTKMCHICHFGRPRDKSILLLDFLCTL